MRAMSLVSSEGESEQNEMRLLQEKLDVTVTLVAQLSAQLAELKEQVMLSSQPSKCYDSPNEDRIQTSFCLFPMVALTGLIACMYVLQTCKKNEYGKLKECRRIYCKI